MTVKLVPGAVRSTTGARSGAARPSLLAVGHEASVGGERGGGRAHPRTRRAGLWRQHRLRQARRRAHRRRRSRELQRNIVLSHAAGVGEPATPVETTRLMLALKLASLAQGASGVRARDAAAARSDAGART